MSNDGPVFDCREAYDTPHIWDKTDKDPGRPAGRPSEIVVTNPGALSALRSGEPSGSLYHSLAHAEAVGQFRDALEGERLRARANTVASWALVPKRFGHERLSEMLSRRQIFAWQFEAAMQLQRERCPSQALEAVGPYAREVALIALGGLRAGDIADPRADRSKGTTEVMHRLRAGLDRLAGHYAVQAQPVTGEQVKAEAVRLKANDLIRMQIAYGIEVRRACHKHRPRMNLFTGWSLGRNDNHYRITRGVPLDTFQEYSQLAADRFLLWIQARTKTLNLCFYSLCANIKGELR